MPLSTDVNLPKDHPPRFPDRCVLCGCPSPSSTVRVITGSIGWWTWLLWVFGKPFIAKAPACAGCSWRLHLQRLASLLVTIALILVALAYVWPLLSQHVPERFHRWGAMIVALLCLVPQLVFEVFYPHAFDVTAYSDSVDYAFRDPVLALEFAALNEDAEWVKIS